MVRVRVSRKSFSIFAVFAVLLLGCEKNHPPNLPSNPSPANGATNQPTALTLSWTGGDPDGDTVTYILFFGTSANPPKKDSGLTSPSLPISDIINDTTYYWKVRAEDERGSVSEGPIWSFTTSPNHPPNIPSTPSGPLNGFVDTTYFISAQTTDPDGDSIAYQYDWGDGTTSSWSVFVSSGSSDSMNHSYSIAGTFQIKAKAKDSKGAESDWSSTKSIIISPSKGTVKWRYQIGAGEWSSPAIGSDGTIYVGSFDNYFYALNPDGSLKWRYLIGDSVNSSPAINSDGTIYVGSWDGNLYALNPDGSLRWKYQTINTVYSSPAIGSDGTIYVGSVDHYLYAIHPNGTLKWSYETGYGVYSSPAIGSDGTVYIGSADRYIYALNSDGSLKWRYQAGNFIRSSPAIGSDGTIYVGSDDCFFYAISPDGTLKWRYQTGSSVYSSPTIGSDGTIYVGSDDGNLYVLKPDGTLKWQFQTGDCIYTAPAIGSDGTIYVGSGSELFALDPKGNIKWYYPAHVWSSSPSIGPDGTIYIGSWDNCLYAFQGSGTLANTPWPMFHHDLRHNGRVGGP